MGLRLTVCEEGGGRDKQSDYTRKNTLPQIFPMNVSRVSASNVIMIKLNVNMQTLLSFVVFNPLCTAP